jgi:hypothetical protein
MSEPIYTYIKIHILWKYRKIFRVVPMDICVYTDL